MQSEKKFLILFCLIIILLSIFHKRCNIENFINPCQYHKFDNDTSYIQNLKQQYGRPGIEVEKEKLHPSQYRASWVRGPEPRYKFICNIDEHLNRKCYWKPIYTKFYPDLRGDQENMISP
jgi:hypothetical protein